MMIRFKAACIAAVTALTLLAYVVAAPAAFASSNLRWTGHARDSNLWSAAANWGGGVVPTTGGSYNVLSFAKLPKSCFEDSGGRTCYFGQNDVANLSVNAIDLNDNLPYEIEGAGITVGSGGLTATPGAAPTPILRGKARLGHANLAGAARAWSLTRFDGIEQESEEIGESAALDFPIALSAAQSWSVLTHKPTHQIYADGGLEVATVTGDYPLTLKLDNGAELDVDGATEVGALTASGKGTIFAGTSVNGITHNPVTLEHDTHLQFASPKAATGPLDLETGSSLDVSSGTIPTGTVSVAGALTLGSTTTLNESIDRPGIIAGKDFSQVTASGDVSIAGKLDLTQRGGGSGQRCQDLHVGDVDALVSTAGTLTGTFSNAPNGATVKVENSCNHANQDATVVINYTSTAATATVKSSGDAGTVPYLKKSLRLKGRPGVGHTLTLTGSWENHPTSYRYYWVACGRKCTRIKHAKTSYKLTSADLGKFILVEVVAINKSGKGFGGAGTGPVTKTGRYSGVTSVGFFVSFG